MPCRVGPFEVLERVGKLAYRLDLPTLFKVHPVISVAKLEPAPLNDIQFSNPPPIQMPDGEVKYEIDRIVQQRKARQGLQYLVRWAGYSDADNTWEPAAYIRKKAPKVVQIWEQGASQHITPQHDEDVASHSGDSVRIPH